MIKKLIVSLFNSDKLAKRLLSPIKYAEYIGLNLVKTVSLQQKTLVLSHF